MPELPRLSKWQVIFRNFEGSVWDTEGLGVRTARIQGAPISVPGPMAVSVANEISKLIELREQHESMSQRRRAQRAAAVEGEAESEGPPSDVLRQIEAHLNELRGEVPITVDVPTGSTEGLRVDPAQIEFYEVIDNSTISVNVYPRSFRCHWCGHYEIVDPESPRPLYCPCCRSFCPSCREQVTEPVNGTCPVCGSKTRRSLLDQFRYVFVCPRCASIEEFTPAIARLEDVRGHQIECPECHNGHLHFYIKDSFNTAFWRCTNSNCRFRNRTDDNRLNKFCRCHIRRGSDGEQGRPSIMKPIITSAPSISYPLIKSYLYLGAEPVNLANLKAEQEKQSSMDRHSWRLSDGLSEPDIRILADLGIKDSFTVPRINTSTVVYGYKSNVSSFPHVIEDYERMGQLFGSHNRYKAYLVNTVGRALVVVLDKERFVRLLRLTDTSYEAIVDDAINHLENDALQELLENPERVPLVTAFHALEHAYFKTVTRQVGLEVFGSKLLLRDCSIVLYEREEVGSGGLIQVTSGSQGAQFKRLIHGVWNAIKSCDQGCRNACPACVFVNDFYCQPFVPNEVERWLPPNSLLDRELAAGYMSPPMEGAGRSK